jgi:hypothetical protein
MVDKPTSAEDFMAAATKLVELPLSGKAVRIRRLTGFDLLDLPEAWPIFSQAYYVALKGKEDKTDTEEALLEKFDEAFAKLGEVSDAEVKIISRGCIEPEVSPEKMTENGKVSYWVFSEVDKRHLIQEIIALTAGVDADAQKEAAERIATFRGSSDGETGDKSGPAVREDAE